MGNEARKCCTELWQLWSKLQDPKWWPCQHEIQILVTQRSTRQSLAVIQVWRCRIQRIHWSQNVFALHFRFNVAMTGMAVQVRLPFGSLQISFKGRPSAVPCAGLNVESSILDLNHWPENQTKDVERHEVIRFDVISVESFNCIQLQLLARAKAQRLTVSHTSLFNSQHKYPEISRNAEKKIKKGVIFLFFDSFCFSHPMAFLAAAESCAQVRDSLNKPRLGVTLRPRRPSETQ